MAWEKVSMCNGCAECIGCGRRNDIRYIPYCDNCGCEITPDDFTFRGSELCSDCLEEVLVKTAIQDGLGDEVDLFEEYSDEIENITIDDLCDY